MIGYIIYFCISAFIVEYITEVVRRKEIFKPIRDYLTSFHNRVGIFFNKLFSCGFCVSFWISLFVTVFSIIFNYLPVVVVEDLLNLIICTILTAGLSNNWHGFKDRNLETYKDNRYNPIVLVLSQTNGEVD